MKIRRALLAAPAVSVMSLSALSLSAHAGTVVVNDQVVVQQANYPVPSRGMTMSAVEKQFGQPADRKPTVGGAPSQPPITRWDYQGFSVFFERDRVIHAVATG